MKAWPELDRAADALMAGGLVVYPTETVYGIAADATSGVAVERLLTLKGRDAAKGIALLVASLEAAAPLIAEEPPTGARALAHAFWPGALTLVLRAAPDTDRRILGPGGGIGLRCSSDAAAQALLARFGRPLTSTSANPSGLPPATTVAAARAYFGDRVDAYVDGGPREHTLVSTVVEFSQARAYLRRAGAIGLDALRAVTAVESVVD